MPLVLVSLFSAIGNAVGGLFNFKGEQAKTISAALDVVKSIDTNDAASVTATANALQLILTQGSYLEKNWRSWLMIVCMGVLVSSWWGYIPPHFNDALSPMMSKCFDLLDIGLGGYIARRGVVDIVRMFNIGSILKTLIAKKVL